jgi:hypothetical protein
MAAKIARSKTYLDGVGKDLVDRLKEQPKIVDAERKRTREFLDALKEETRMPLTIWEDAEESRILSIKQRIDLMKFNEDEITSEKLNIHMARLKKTDVNDGSFEEFKNDATACKLHALERCEKLLEESIKKEAEIAELKRLREESAERDQKEREERLIKEAEERGKREAEEKSRLETEKKEREEMLAKEAEEKRINDRNHRAKINNEIVQSLIDNGFLSETAKNLCIMLNKNMIKHVTINF